MGIVRFESLSMSMMAVSPVMLRLPSAPVLLSVLVDQGDGDVVNHHIFAFGVLGAAKHDWFWHWCLWFGERGGIYLDWLALRGGDLE